MRIRTPEQKAREAAYAKFRYHNNAEHRAYKQKKMRERVVSNKTLTPEQREKRNAYYRSYELRRAKTPRRMEQRREAQRRYRKTHKGRKNYYSKWKGTEGFKKAKLRYTKKWRERNPHKAAAHNAVQAALGKGRLKKEPCEICKETQVVAHHDDYSKPLSVRWLCRNHHNLIHCIPRYKEQKLQR